MNHSDVAVLDSLLLMNVFIYNIEMKKQSRFFFIEMRMNFTVQVSH